MAFDPHLPTRAAVRDYFAGNGPVADAAAAFFAAPTHAAGRDLLRAYFRTHRPGDVAGLRMAVASFADKRLVRGVVQSVLDDEETLRQVAAKSYPHPIGFDKLVLDDDRATGFKFRLHVYWRGANFAALERLHLHRFEMASAVVTGELTNHVWRVADYRPANAHLPALAVRADGDGGERKNFVAYSGYRRDAAGNLRKTHLGECVLEKGPAETFTSGDAYAQVLEDAHFVETNAETGFANGDFCSTVYVHGPSLTDGAGRTLPVLFEEQRLADDDQLIQTIPAMTPEDLRKSLTRYRDTLDEILKFYDWVYDPKHGRNLSAGMVAGYLLCEAFHTPHAIDVFEKQYERCKEILQRHETAVRDCLQGDGCPPADRTGRYITLLVAKAKAHAAGPAAWLADNGSLTKEMWRYFGAIRGEAGETITVLKPVWAGVVKRKLPGGMHHGHVAAMIEAAYDANHMAMKAFAAGATGTAKDDYNVVSAADAEIETHIVRVLKSHYPSYHFHGEEGGDISSSPPPMGATFLPPPLPRGGRGGLSDFPRFHPSTPRRPPLPDRPAGRHPQLRGRPRGVRRLHRLPRADGRRVGDDRRRRVPPADRQTLLGRARRRGLPDRAQRLGNPPVPAARPARPRQPAARATDRLQRHRPRHRRPSRRLPRPTDARGQIPQRRRRRPDSRETRRPRRDRGDHHRQGPRRGSRPADRQRGRRDRVPVHLPPPTRPSDGHRRRRHARPARRPENRRRNRRRNREPETRRRVLTGFPRVIT